MLKRLFSGLWNWARGDGPNPQPVSNRNRRPRRAPAYMRSRYRDANRVWSPRRARRVLARQRARPWPKATPAHSTRPGPGSRRLRTADGAVYAVAPAGNWVLVGYRA